MDGKSAAKGTRIVIVGASSGIGAELARQYAKLRPAPQIVLAARRVDRLKEVAEACAKNGAPETACVATDATKNADCKALMAKTIDLIGGIDLMIYCVGQAMHVKFGDITEVEKVCAAMMDTNFTGCVWCTAAAFPHLKASKGQAVVISSVAGEISPPYLSFYAAAKHAVQGPSVGTARTHAFAGFYESLQNEESGVDFTIVCPGYVATEIDDKKVMGDGSVQSVELNVDKSKYMPAETAAKLIIDAQQKKKKKYQLTTAGSIGTTMHALFPGLVNSAVKDEMKKISDVKKDKGKEKDKDGKDKDKETK